MRGVFCAFIMIQNCLQNFKLKNFKLVIKISPYGKVLFILFSPFTKGEMSRSAGQRGSSGVCTFSNPLLGKEGKKPCLVY